MLALHGRLCSVLTLPSLAMLFQSGPNGNVSCLPIIVMYPHAIKEGVMAAAGQFEAVHLVQVRSRGGLWQGGRPGCLVGV